MLLRRSYAAKRFRGSQRSTFVEAPPAGTNWTIAARKRLSLINYGTPWFHVLPPPGDPSS